MTSMDRVLAALNHREADRVPFFLLLTTHGAKALGMGIREYFSRPQWVAEGQSRLRKRYRHDCLYGFHYAAVEHQAFGGEVVYVDDGPPNAGAPLVKGPEQVASLSPPRISDSPGLVGVLECLTMLSRQAAGEVPVIGVVMSPFSLPVMQLGFELYLELLCERPDLVARLMRVNTEFCVAWANAQLAAGANAICYFDPVSSPDIIPRDIFLGTGFPVARETISRIEGPTVVHLASGRALPVLDQLSETGAAGVGVSAQEDLARLKEACLGRLAVVGNLDGIAMRRWSAEEAACEVRSALAAAGSGGGFILSDNHGEIPWQVTDEVLLAISEEVHRSGCHPSNGEGC